MTFTLVGVFAAGFIACVVLEYVILLFVTRNDP